MKLYEEAELYFIVLNQQIITTSGIVTDSTSINDIDSEDSYNSDSN